MQGYHPLPPEVSAGIPRRRFYIGLAVLWLSLLTLLWGMTPWLLCQARVIACLGVLSSLLALAGWLLPWQPLVMWSGLVGLGNFTLALLITATPPNALLGLTTGCILFALLDGSQHFAYLRYCRIEPGVIAVLLRATIRLCGLTFVTGLTMGFFLTILPLPQGDIAAALWLTLGGAILFVGFLGVFLFQSSR